MTTIYLKNARASFVEGLYKAKAFKDGKPKFSCDFLIDEKTTIQEIEDGKRVDTTMDAVLLKVATEAWKAKGAQVLKSLEASKCSYRDGSKRDPEIYEAYQGLMYVTAKNKKQPTLVGADGKALDRNDDYTIYSGCRVNVKMDIYANLDPTERGVFAGLLGVQFAGDDESFGVGSRVASEDDFEPLDIGADADDIDL